MSLNGRLERWPSVWRPGRGTIALSRAGAFTPISASRTGRGELERSGLSPFLGPGPWQTRSHGRIGITTPYRWMPQSIACGIYGRFDGSVVSAEVAGKVRSPLWQTSAVRAADGYRTCGAARSWYPTRDWVSATPASVVHGSAVCTQRPGTHEAIINLWSNSVTVCFQTPDRKLPWTG